jgi:anti-sigma factor RsiW
MSSTYPDSDPRVLADISALADGSLPADRVEDVEARVAASPELTRLLADERRAVDTVRALTTAERAPHRLRLEVESRRPAPRSRSFGRRPAILGLLGAAVAVVLAILLIPGGTVGGPSLADAAGLASRGPTAAAPAPDPRAPNRRLTQAVGEVYFPRWAASLGWRATGQRADRLGGHRAVTVFYRRGTETIAYTILSAPPLDVSDGTPFRAGQVSGRGVRLGSRQVVTWRRSGLTCIISSADARPAELQQLAGWTPANPSA